LAIAAFRRRMSILGDFDLAIRVRHYPSRRVRPRDPWTITLCSLGRRPD
jgi:hypothetical protein